MLNSLLTSLILLMAVTGCSRSSVVKITNRSSMTLSNLVLSGSGFTNHIERITPGEEKDFTPRSRGESGLRITFEVGGRSIDSGELGYFEANGYHVSAVINTNFTVSV